MILHDKIVLAIQAIKPLDECPDFKLEAMETVVNSDVSAGFLDGREASFDTYTRLCKAAVRRFILCKRGSPDDATGEDYVKHAVESLTWPVSDISPEQLEEAERDVDGIVQDVHKVLAPYSRMLDNDMDLNAVSFVGLMLDTFNDAYRFLHLRGNTGDPTHWPGTMVPRLRVLRNRWWADGAMSEETKSFFKRVGLGPDAKKRIQDFAAHTMQRAETILSMGRMRYYNAALAVLDEYKLTRAAFQ